MYTEETEGVIYRATKLPTGEGLSWLARADGENEHGMSRFVASTGAVDRMGDVVEQSWRLANFRRNPVILHEHAHPVVGRGSVKVDREADALMLSVEWDDSEANPVGRLVAHQHRAGFRGAVSVGFRPGKSISRTKLPDDHPAKMSDDMPEWQAGRVFRFNELLEVSSVAIPANAEALQVRAYAEEADDPAEAVARYLRETTPSQLRGLLADYIRDCPESLGVIRAIVLGTPRSVPSGGTTTRRMPWDLPRRKE